MRRRYGYELTGSPIPAEQSMIRLIVAMFDGEQLTPKEITKQLNREHSPPMNSYRWHKVQVVRILERESDEYSPEGG